jgi:polyribonucleotide nucleotidyltransferase
MSYTFQRLVGGKPLIFEVGKLAGQAEGAVSVRYGDTIVLATACSTQQPREGVDFVPLTIDFEERLYAAGKIPGSFFRREGRPSQEATLTSRLTDRSLRPLFPKGFRQDVQVIVTVLSADQENPPDILSVVGASAALHLSPLPFEGPVGAVRVGYSGGSFFVNPTFSQINESPLELVVAGTKAAVVMVEAGAREVPEDLLMQALRFGQEANQEIIRLQEEIREKLGQPKMSFQPWQPSPEAAEAVAHAVEGRLLEALRGDKAEREAKLDELEASVLEKLKETYPPEEIVSAFDAHAKRTFRETLLKEGRRPDGRPLSELRPISAEVGLLPRTHGSGLFTRGNTQVLTITTLGSTREEQELDTLSPEETKRFIHHYNFPPFSTGEVKRVGSPGRREIGHGALVEKALEPILPSEAEFPYTIRLVSEVLSSSGSTSMASACASSLSLMDAGVPIKTGVGGVAMGLVTGENGKYVILTDIEGLEDAYGDMDFKVAGTEKGTTAVQLDIKLKGVAFEILEQALKRAREARLQVLEKMRQTIAQPRPQLSPHAPRMYRMTIPTEKIGALIGPGGRRIRSIIEETKASIDVNDNGSVVIGSTNEDAAQKAMKMIQNLTQEVEVGTIFTGKVTRILPNGAMVEILPGKEGLVPVEELAEYDARRPGDVVKVGDEIMVKVMEIDRLGRVNLSRRAVFQGVQPGGPRPTGGRPSRPLPSHQGPRYPRQPHPRDYPPRQT